MKTAHLHRLEAWAQEEIQAQRSFGDVLAAYERSIVLGEIEGLADGAVAVRNHLERSTLRDERRTELLGTIAADLRVGTGTLTLGSLCVRAGDRAQRLSAARVELIAATRRAGDLARRVLILSRAQQQVLSEVLEAAFGKGEAVMGGQGRLVDTQV
jgi:hypothetical protein